MCLDLADCRERQVGMRILLSMAIGIIEMLVAAIIVYWLLGLFLMEEVDNE